MLFTSGSPKNENKKYGGGIYKLDVKGDKWSYKKMISGNCYGLIKFGENFVSVDADIGVFEFDRNFKIIRSKKLPEGIRAHGIDYSTNSPSICVYKNGDFNPNNCTFSFFALDNKLLSNSFDNNIISQYILF